MYATLDEPAIVLPYKKAYVLVQQNGGKVNRGNFVTRVIPSLGFCLDSCSLAVGFKVTTTPLLYNQSTALSKPKRM